MSFVIYTIFQTATEIGTQYQPLNVLDAVLYSSNQSGIILNFLKFDIKSFSHIALLQNKKIDPWTSEIAFSFDIYTA